MNRHNGLSSSTPSVSIIVPVYRDTAGLRRCLDALRGQTWPSSRYEVLVVDNEGDEKIRQICESRGVMRLVETRPGSYAARNAGIRAAGGEIIAFTDSDCTPDSIWVEHGVTALLADTSVGVVGGRVRVVPREEHSPNIAEACDMLVAFPQRSEIETKHKAVTANLFTTHAVIESVGTFEEALMSGGDGEWTRRVWEYGFALRYSNDAVVTHPALPSLRSQLRKLRRTTAGQASLYRRRRDLWPAFSTSGIVRGFRPPLRRIQRTAAKAPVRGCKRVTFAAILLLRRYWKLACTMYYKLRAGATKPRV